jgi:Protein of unknown function, DUF481
VLIPIVVALLAQSPSTLDERAVIAAEKAADAAARAADAAQKSAEALQKLAELEAAEKAGEAAGAKPAEAAKPPAAPSPWSGGAALGFTYLAGNANSLTFAGNANIQRKSERWIIGAKLFGAFGETTAPANGNREVVALNAGLTAQVDFRIIEKVSIFVAGGFDTDHVKAVEARGFGEIGVGVLWVDVKAEDYQKVMFKTDVGFRLQGEGRYNYYPTAALPCEGNNQVFPAGSDVDASGNPIDLPSCASKEGGGGSALVAAPRAALAFKFALTKSIVFTNDFEILPSVIKADAADPARVLINNTAKLSLRVWENFGIGASWALKFDSFPARGKKDLDNAVIGTVDVNF